MGINYRYLFSSSSYSNISRILFHQL